MRVMFWAYAAFIRRRPGVLRRDGPDAAMSSAPPPRGFLRDNSLSLVFGGLLLATLAGQAVWGVAGYNAEARTAGLQQVSLWRYVTSSGFAVDVAENWQSEFLQFVLFIALTVCARAAGVVGVEGARRRGARGRRAADGR